ncbi:asparaginase [Bacillus horti]|uniref:asparaginase n=1 Tax=Caldalkalibacillus horti TaxID=77523 RepID=A0ABT9W6P8_9BACI|nr:asparaginase [Bacillus horti]MDQ0168525.1 L-asparaginase [Bacillus horti]
MKKTILIMHTGGTIAMSEDSQTGAVKPTDQNPLDTSLPILEPYANIVVEQYDNIPSPHMTPQRMFELAKAIELSLNKTDIHGLVLTHGTDTLEETAYMLDLLVQSHKPIIVTGAMRSSNELGADGPFNLLQSVRVAASDEAQGKGVLVVFNDEIHTAKNVTKTHTSNLSTFQSPQYGPIGIITKHVVSFHHLPIGREFFVIKQLTKRVLLLKAFAGMEAEWLDALLERDPDGLVIEAFGQGNLPPSVMPAIRKSLDRNIPIVLVSRSFNGIVEGVYGYEGGGKQLQELGVIFSNGLNGQKARIKLMVALEETNDIQKLKAYFSR